MPPSDDHRQARAAAKARRNERARDRRRRGESPAVSWQRFRRCVVCGRYITEAQTAEYGLGWRICEACHVVAELRRESRRRAGDERRAA